MTLVLLDVRLSLILTVGMLAMVVVHSQAKIQRRLIEVVHIWLDILQKISSLLDLLVNARLS